MSKEKEEKIVAYEELRLENAVYMTEVPESFKNREIYKPVDNKKLKATIPGTIMDIYSKKGQKVEAGENLLILEAMKMRNKVNSPINGVIKEIHVKSGDVVRKGALLIVFK